MGSVPEQSSTRFGRLALGHPFYPLAAIAGKDPFDVEVIPSLTEAMARRSSFDIEQLDLMNLRVDAAKGVIVDEPAALMQARELMKIDPVRAMHMALAAAAIVAADLHDRITESA